ncbi:epoxide hydrolase [Periconia macrospinosa]|uniref:Epoxide hydrolase n=1 Tax=Periconia macrospinosa TaxID=97972 RepID=A0A2V1D5W9_9PLEO|nr:epoxide hydrolase [Periconia macrospinosa]
MALQHLSKSFKVADGTAYSYVHIAPTSENKTFLLLHGFPSSGYDWRRQIKTLGEKGYGVIVPDLLGYGDTDKPSQIENYKWKTMAGHIAEILAHEGYEKVIGVSHDWGSGLLSRVYNYYPQLLEKLVFVAVPYMEPATFNLDAINELTIQAFGYPVFGYWKFFNGDDAAKICDEHNNAVTSLLYPVTPVTQRNHLCPFGAAKEWISNGTVPKEIPTWLSPAEISTHNDILGKGGYTGPLNWYKAVIRGYNDEDEANIPDDRRTINAPTLFINGLDDPITRPEVAEQISQSGRIPNVTLSKIAGAGHWVYLEKEVEFLDSLLNFVKTA